MIANITPEEDPFRDFNKTVIITIIIFVILIFSISISIYKLLH